MTTYTDRFAGLTKIEEICAENYMAQSIVHAEAANLRMAKDALLWQQRQAAEEDPDAVQGDYTVVARAMAYDAAGVMMLEAERQMESARRMIRQALDMVQMANETDPTRASCRIS